MKTCILNTVLALLLTTLFTASNTSWSEAQQAASLIGKTRQVPDQTMPAPSLIEVTSKPNTGFHGSHVMFIENIGQWDTSARFQVWAGTVGTLWLAQDAIWATILEPAETSFPRDRVLDSMPEMPLKDDGVSPARRGVNIKLSFLGANPQPHIETFDRLDTAVNYFYGNDPEQWRPQVSVWGGVRYVNVYPGVDLEITSENGQMVQRFRTQPGAELPVVQMRVEGADAAIVDDGYLRLNSIAGEYALPLPHVAGSSVQAFVKKPLAQVFEVTLLSVNASRLTPHLPADSPTHLLYGTFVGGSSDDFGRDIEVDGLGNIYVVGSTGSTNFPTTPGAFDITHNSLYDTFVVKLNPTGSVLMYATFLGGSGDDYGLGIDVDQSGSVFVAGETASGNFPTTPGSFSTVYRGFWDGFVVKLNPTGSELTYGTYLGGSNSDGANAITVDGVGNAYITGYTGSSNFPVTPGAFDTGYNGWFDAFVAKVNPTGSALVYSTFLGGILNDRGSSIAVDGIGSAYVTGWAGSWGFPVTPGAFDTSHNGGDYDTFVARINPTGTALVYSTFLGGNSNDYGQGIAIDRTGNAYVTGSTGSVNFPTTPEAFDGSFNGSVDAFVIKLNSTGSALTYATFLGGSSPDRGYSIAVDGTNNAYVTGETLSTNFPTTPNAFDTRHNGGTSDAYMVKLNSVGDALTYATFLGGSGYDVGRAITYHESRGLFVTGSTSSVGFPTTPGAFDTSHNGSYDVFVARLANLTNVYLPVIVVD